MGEALRKPEKPVIDELTKLLKRAERGNTGALAEVADRMKAHPTIWREVGDLGRLAEQAWIDMTAGKNRLFAEAFSHTIAAIKTELAGPEPSVLERLLVDRVVACWIQIEYADLAYAQLSTALSSGHRDYLQRRQDRAHRRYLSAIRTLAQVRRLLQPVVQVNIGGQQVNVATAAGTEYG